MTSLVTCPACSKEYSINAASCLGCGEPNAQAPKPPLKWHQKKWVVVLWMALFMPVGFYALFKGGHLKTVGGWVILIIFTMAIVGTIKGNISDYKESDAGQLEAAIEVNMCQPFAKSQAELIDSNDIKMIIATGTVKRSEMVKIIDDFGDDFCSCYKSYLVGELKPEELQPTLAVIKEDSGVNASENIKFIMQSGLRSCTQDATEIFQSAIKSAAR